MHIKYNNTMFCQMFFAKKRQNFIHAGFWTYHPQKQPAKIIKKEAYL